MSYCGVTGRLAIALIVVTGTVSAQAPSGPLPLAEVARQAEVAKATTKKATKTYTNADLSPDTRAQQEPAPAPAGFMSSALGKVVSAEEMIERSEEKVTAALRDEIPEPQWRARAESLRVQVAKLQTLMAALTKPNDARDANAGAKARNDAEVVKIQQGLAAVTKQWATLEESARVAKIPTDWLDPRPAQLPR